MSVYPAATRMPLVVSAPAIENGPGPQVGSSYSSGLVTKRSTICCARYIQSFSIFARQTDHHQPASGHERAADVAQRRHGVREEHRAEARERHVVRPAESGVCTSATAKRTFATPDRAASSMLASTKRGATSTPTTEPAGPTSRGDLLRRVPEAATDVEHALRRGGGESSSALVPNGAEAVRHHLPELDEAVEQRTVPRRRSPRRSRRPMSCARRVSSFPLRILERVTP